jgi:hypothetical protein
MTDVDAKQHARAFQRRCRFDADAGVSRALADRDGAQAWGVERQSIGIDRLRHDLAKVLGDRRGVCAVAGEKFEAAPRRAKDRPAIRRGEGRPSGWEGTVTQLSSAARRFFTADG